jgi:hypothetical protein
MPPTLDATSSHNGLPAWADRDMLMNNAHGLLATAADAIERHKAILVGAERARGCIHLPGCFDRGP